MASTKSSRDVGVVIDDGLVATRMMADRAAEWRGIAPLLTAVRDSHVLTPPEEFAWKVECDANGEIWVGHSAADDLPYTTARTNEAALDWLSDQYTDWRVRGFELTKSDDDPRANALHLDCCLSVLAGSHAIFHANGLKHEEDRAFIRSQFEADCSVDADEMYDMQCNLISITPEDVVSARPLNT